MKKPLTSVLCLMFAVAFMAFTTAAKADGKQCVIMSKEELLIGIEPYVRRAFIIPAEMREAYFVNLNKLRKKNGTFEIAADEMIVFETKKGGYGIEIFFEGCVLPFVTNILPKQGMEVFFRLTGGEAITAFIEDPDA